MLYICLALSCLLLAGVYIEMSHCHNQFADDFLQNPMGRDTVRLHPRLTAKDLG